MIVKFMHKLLKKTFSPTPKSNFNISNAFTIITRHHITTKSEFAALRRLNKKKSYTESKSLKLILLGIPTISFALGIWQIQRYHWKSLLLEEMKKRTSQNPIELPLDLEEIKNKEYYPVKVRGQFLNEKEILIGPRSLMINNAQGDVRGIISTQPNSGFFVITPFKLQDQDTTILVNRGWIPKHLKNPATRKSSQINDVIEIKGLLRLDEKGLFMVDTNYSQGVWIRRDIHGIAEQTGADPIFIDLVSKHNLPNAPISGQTNLKLRNEHVSYIFTWLSLSGLTGWMWYRKYLQKLPKI